MKRKKIIPILAALLFIIGACAIMYPSFSNWLNEKNSSKVVSVYNEHLEDLKEPNYSNVKNAAIDHNRRIEESGSLTIAYHMEIDDEMEEYNSLLNIAGDSMMGTVRIPKIHVSLPIYHTTDDAVIQVGAGHFVGSSLPIGGEGTHCVLSSHRGLVSAKLFTELDAMEKGDRFYIDVLNDTNAYEVDQIKTVLPDELDDLQIEPGKDYVTLLTCTPYGVNTHRLLVRGKRIPYEPKVEKKDIQKSEKMVKSETNRRFGYVGIYALVVFGIAIFAGIRLGDKYRKKELEEQNKED